jgi:predicted transcriptional regulator
MAEKKPTPRQQLVGMITSYWSSMAIHVAAKLKLADHVQNGPKTAQELAKLSKTQPAALYRLLRALASVEIFAEDADGRFRLTPMAEC